MQNKRFEQHNHDQYDAIGKAGAAVALEDLYDWEFIGENLEEQKGNFKKCFDLTFKDKQGGLHKVEAEVKRTCYWNEKGEIAYNPIHIPARKQGDKYSSVELFVIMDEEAMNFCIIPAKEVQEGFIDSKPCKNNGGRQEPFVCVLNRPELYHHL
jgi:hypothetical protein